MDIFPTDCDFSPFSPHLLLLHSTTTPQDCACPDLHSSPQLFSYCDPKSVEVPAYPHSLLAPTYFLDPHLAPHPPPPPPPPPIDTVFVKHDHLPADNRSASLIYKRGPALVHPASFSSSSVSSDTLDSDDEDTPTSASYRQPPHVHQNHLHHPQQQRSDLLHSCPTPSPMSPSAFEMDYSISSISSSSSADSFDSFAASASSPLSSFSLSFPAPYEYIGSTCSSPDLSSSSPSSFAAAAHGSISMAASISAPPLAPQLSKAATFTCSSSAISAAATTAAATPMANSTSCGYPSPSKPLPRAPTYVQRRGRKPSLVEDPTKAFVCAHCNRRFRRHEHLKRHFRSLHTREKPFRCDKCSKSFSRSDNLTQHIRTHVRGGRIYVGSNDDDCDDGGDETDCNPLEDGGSDDGSSDEVEVEQSSSSTGRRGSARRSASTGVSKRTQAGRRTSKRLAK
ncbi:hypothetical protein BZA70DRAFT_275374 [Myxozyma melibiosi]|uniref:C2H2-type domain-containing protein n=1 Tax=Myxozyma melibiosi TaxID=54550 RepID=A0ABR1FAZ9_9ASCO